MVSSGPPRRPRVILCGSADDVEFATWLSRALSDLGHNPWLDHENARGGFHTLNVLQEALDQSDVMLLLVTPESVRSRLVTSQWTYFYFEREKPLVPLIIHPMGPSDTLNFVLASLQSIDFTRDNAPSMESSLGQLHATLLHIYDGLPNGTDDIPSSYQTPDSGEDDLSCRQAGLLRVHHAIPKDRVIAWMQTARQTVRVMTTWTGLLYDQPDLFYPPVKNGCTVQILLLNPSSLFARQRSLDIHLGTQPTSFREQEVPRNIRATIRQLADLYQALDGLPGRLELRLYDVLPSFSIHQCDTLALIGFFPHSARTTTFPMLEVDTGSLLGRRFGEEFNAIWSNALIVDLSPRLPVRQAGDGRAIDDPLSSRELEILRLIATGLTNQEIAQELVVTLATVKKHINNIYSKLGVTSRTRAILRARELHLIDQ